MFTGLVEATGSVVLVTPAGTDQARISLTAPFAEETGVGDSVAVNGCCLTVAASLGNSLSFDVLTQTLRVTSLGDLLPGTTVNLERAMRADGRFGGHFVQGHVDATGTITHIETRGQDHVLTVSVPEQLLRFCIDKGSLAVDGISLTIAELEGDSARFWITPHTWAHTNLASARSGQRVNLEADLIAKHVERLLRR
jgi:riboflavin synthase